MNDERRPQWLRGVLDLCVLAALAGPERYGYELAQLLEQAGLGELKGGTLYPLLARLQKAGHVAAAWREGDQGPSRKYYSLTRKGRAYLTAQSGEWMSFAATIESVLSPRKKKR